MFFDNNNINDDDCAVLLPPEDSSNYESLHKFVVAQGTEFRLSASTNPDLEAVINFSRAFYNLDPSVAALELVSKSERMGENSKTAGECDGNGDNDATAATLDSPYFLSQPEYGTFDSWQTLVKSSGDDMRLSSPADVGQYVLRFLNSCCCSDATSGNSDNDTTTMTTPTSTHDTTAKVFKGITRVHIRALEDMMSLLPSRNASYRMDQLQVMHPRTHPTTHFRTHPTTHPHTSYHTPSHILPHTIAYPSTHPLII